MTGYSGNAGDGFNHINDKYSEKHRYKQNGQPFSTKDQDNDNYTTTHCAQKFKAGFWYAQCLASDLFGDMQWHDTTHHEVREAVMKMYPN